MTEPAKDNALTPQVNIDSASHSEPTKVRVVCERCNGKGAVPTEFIPCGKGRMVAAMEPCPECSGDGSHPATMLPLTGDRRVVVMDEAWNAFVQVLANGTRIIRTDDEVGKRVMFLDTGALADEALTALFPSGIEVAEAVGTLCDSGVGDPTAYLSIGNATDGTYRTIDGYDITGRRVAVLGKEQGNR